MKIWIVVPFACAACSAFEFHSSLMIESASSAPVPRDRARIVFAQEPDRDHPNQGLVRIVDEHGAVLGDSLPHTWFSADLAPGEHAFFGWESMHETAGVADCSCFMGRCGYVAATRMNLVAGRTYVVSVRVRDLSSGDSPSSEQIDFEQGATTDGLRAMSTRDALAARHTREHAADYESSLLCVGRKRLNQLARSVL